MIQIPIAQATSALGELRDLLDRVQSAGRLTDLQVSDGTDALTGFRTQYTARTIANRAIGSDREFRYQLTEDIKAWIAKILALKEYLETRSAGEDAPVDWPTALARYAERAKALDVFLGTLLGSYEPLDGDITLKEAQSDLVKLLRGKSEREIFQVVSRVLPVSADVDDQLTGLLYVLMRKAHNEPAVDRVLSEQNNLMEVLNYPVARDFAASQALRDYVAPYLASLIKKALSDEGVEAFDDAFRSTYFAIVNRVINYYQTYRPEAVAEAQTIDDRHKTLGSEPTDGKSTAVNHQSSIMNHELGVENQQSQKVPEGDISSSNVDTAANSTPLPPFDEPEPTVITPLLSEQEVETITHEDLDSLDSSADTKQSPKKVTGTGLE